MQIIRIFKLSLFASVSTCLLSCTMGVKLIILLGLLIGVLYCIHILVKDYQAITAAKVFRLIFKRDITSHYSYKAHVHWGRILQYDTIQCTRYLFCDLGASEIKTHLRDDFTYMLTLEPQEADVAALDVFKIAYSYGKSAQNTTKDPCRAKYPACPFKIDLLYDVIQYLLRTYIII